MTAGDRWVVDGNYPRVRDLVWARASGARVVVLADRGPVGRFVDELCDGGT